MRELITSAMLANTEALINRALELDPVSRKKLQALSGMVMQIDCSNPKLAIYLAIFEQEVRLFSSYDGEISTSIKGSARALLQLLLAEDKRQSFYRDDLEIKGKLDNVQALQELVSELQFDWEYHLGKIAGDIPTQMFSDGLRDLHALLQSNKQNLLRNLDDYLHQERRLFPGKVELEAFHDSIDQLRLRVDRASARVSRIERSL